MAARCISSNSILCVPSKSALGVDSCGSPHDTWLGPRCYTQLQSPWSAADSPSIRWTPRISRPPNNHKLHCALVADAPWQSRERFLVREDPHNDFDLHNHRLERARFEGAVGLLLLLTVWRRLDATATARNLLRGWSAGRCWMLWPVSALNRLQPSKGRKFLAGLYSWQLSERSVRFSFFALYMRSSLRHDLRFINDNERSS